MKKRKNTTVYYTPTRATLTSHKPLADISNMSREEAHTWIQGMRERAYLDRRAARGTHTPTDEAYEADQLLETELVALLDDMLQGLTQEA